MSQWRSYNDSNLPQPLQTFSAKDLIIIPLKLITKVSLHPVSTLFQIAVFT